MDPWPSGIDAITLFVTDPAAAKDFYRRTFGLSVLFEEEDSVVFNFGNVVVNLLRASQVSELIGPAPMAPREAGARFVFTLEVDDVDAMCTKLESGGVELLNGPMDRPWGIRTASFRDPDGYIWEIARKITS
jgi:catechol 2,3-dioxygenase-like lactoylglutathione lyase family enzyme